MEPSPLRKDRAFAIEPSPSVDDSSPLRKELSLIYYAGRSLLGGGVLSGSLEGSTPGRSRFSAITDLLVELQEHTPL